MARQPRGRRCAWCGRLVRSPQRNGTPEAERTGMCADCLAKQLSALAPTPRRLLSRRVRRRDG